jgi:hypothetical protein
MYNRYAKCTIYNATQRGGGAIWYDIVGKMRARQLLSDGRQTLLRLRCRYLIDPFFTWCVNAAKCIESVLSCVPDYAITVFVF